LLSISRRTTMSDVPRNPDADNASEPTAAEDLLPLVYDELRKRAAQQAAREEPGNTLQPTALVHEAYLRLVGNNPEQRWDGRRHFINAVAEAMRHIQIDRARHKNTRKAGGGHRRIDIAHAEPVQEVPDENLLALDEALLKLEKQHPRQAEVFKLRYFVRLSTTQTAATLGVSASTVEKDSAYARCWLQMEVCHPTSEPS
jgi:RNA polymerase sigma factor (TIGR02999 family)